MKHRKITMFGTLLLIFCISSLINHAAADINSEDTLRPGEYIIESFTIDNETTLRQEDSASHNLIYAENPDLWLNFEAEGDLSVIFVNKSEMAQFVLGNAFTAKHYEANTTNYDLLITYNTLISDFGFETKFQEGLDTKEGELPDDVELIEVYIIIFNEGDEAHQFSLRFDYTNILTSFVYDFFSNLIWMLFLGVGIKLIVDGRKTREENEHQAHIMKGFGFGFVLGGIGTLDWVIYHWYRDFNPSDLWKELFEFDIGSDVFGSNILLFVTFLCLGCSLLFISNTVERNVQNRKVPYMTNTLIIANLSFVAALFIPKIAIYIIYIWMGILAVAALNILIIYIKLVSSTAGLVKKKSFFTILGVAGVYILLLLRNFVLPDVIVNAPACLFIIISYYGIKMK